MIKGNHPLPNILEVTEKKLKFKKIANLAKAKIQIVQAIALSNI